MTKKILLAGASTYGVKNMGDDAMLFNLTQELHKQLDCEITFLARHPDADYDKFFGIHSIKNFEHDSKQASLGRWFLGFNPGDAYEHLNTIKQALLEADLVIIGGNSFMEVSSNQFLRGVASYSALIALQCVFHNKPYALYGVAGHKMKAEFTQEIARFLSGHARLVTVRESFFKEALREAGADSDRVRVAADPAFGLDSVADRDAAKALLARENIRLGAPMVVGIGFRHMYWLWDEAETELNLARMAEFCDQLVERHDADILFIPNCTYHVDTPLEDDRYIAAQVIARMKHPERTHCPQRELDLAETLTLYQAIDILASNRRHSNIFAAIQGKPFFPFASGHPWHFKPFIEDLRLDIPLSSITDDSTATLMDNFAITWNARESIVQQLASVIPGLRHTAREQVEWIARLIKPVT